MYKECEHATWLRKTQTTARPVQFSSIHNDPESLDDTVVIKFEKSLRKQEQLKAVPDELHWILEYGCNIIICDKAQNVKIIVCFVS